MDEGKLIRYFEMFIIQVYTESKKSFYDTHGSLEMFKDKEMRDFFLYTVKNSLELAQKDLIAILDKEQCKSSKKISELIINDFFDKFRSIIERQRDFLNIEEFIPQLKTAFIQIVKDNQSVN